MKATIEFDDELYRRLKSTAALRGKKVRELVNDAVRDSDSDRESHAASLRRAYPQKGYADQLDLLLLTTRAARI